MCLSIYYVKVTNTYMQPHATVNCMLMTKFAYCGRNSNCLISSKNLFTNEFDCQIYLKTVAFGFRI